MAFIITTPGILQGFAVPFPSVRSTDAINDAELTVETDIPGVDATNIAVNSGDLEVDGVTYAAGRVVQFDLEADPDITLTPTPTTSKILITFETDDGELQIHKKSLSVIDAFVIA